MTYKQLIIPTHAADQMAERGITRQDVRWLLARGERQQEASREGAAVRWSRRGYLDNREAMVVYIETADAIELVTVMWVD